jgi:hypothetical protein
VKLAMSAGGVIKSPEVIKSYLPHELELVTAKQGVEQHLGG